ncbi:MAG: kinase [bacterium]|nr:kinase [bacterium]
MNAQRLLADHLQREQLPAELAQLTDQLYLPLLDWALGLGPKRPILLGINGAQGTGKSTTAEILRLLAEELRGKKAACLSIDDLYKTKAERQLLAETHHPLFATRGVPGTHDLALGVQLILALRRGGAVRLPRFDKLADDRAEGRFWPEVGPDLDLLILEGWCVGARPQPEADLSQPVNQLEAQEDPEGIWRAWANQQLKGVYAQLFSQLDGLILLKPDSFTQVKAWRTHQERRMETNTGKRGMDDAQLERFIAHYQRLTQWMLTDLPQVADVVVPVTADHMPGLPQWGSK